MSAVDPITALTQAIYYLDRELAPSTKVRAFQRAIDIVADAGVVEIERRVHRGTIADLPGIGASTGAVITDAVLGRPSAYLDDLEQRSRVEVGDGADLLADQRGDCCKVDGRHLLL